MYSCGPINSIVVFNFATSDPFNDVNDYDSTSQTRFISSWTSLPGAFTAQSPQLTADGFHLAATSPCITGGSSAYASGTDIDGEPWANSPSIGCDQFYDTDARGPLSVGQIIAYAIDFSTPVIENARSYVQTRVAGNANRVAWDFGDGTVQTNMFSFVAAQIWTNAGDYTVTFTVYNYDNPTGVTTNAVVHVVAPAQPLLSSASLSGTNFSLSFFAQPGVSYVVQQATNLVSPTMWQTVGSVYGLGRQSTVTDSNATNSMRYYRVVIP